MQRVTTLRKQFNWRMLLMRIVVNALALVITALVIPTIDFVEDTLLTWFLLAVFLGILNAVIKPIIQFATLRFIFATYGLVVVLINAVVLILLSALLPNRFVVGSLLWALVAGALIGLLSAFLENLFGLTPPIVSEKHPEIRRKIREKDTGSMKAHISETAAKIILPSESVEQPDTTTSAAAVLAVVGAPVPEPGGPDPRAEGSGAGEVPVAPSSFAPSAESTAMQPQAETETRPPAGQETPAASPDSSAPAHREG